MVHSAAWRVASRIVSSAVFGITLLLLARISPVASYGEFMVAGAVAVIAGIVTGFGAPTRVLRSAVEHEPMPLVRGLYLAHLGLILALTALLLAIAAVGGMSATVSAGFLWGTGDVIQMYAQNHFAGLGRHRAASWLVATQRLLPCATVVAYLLQGREADYPVVAAAFAATLLIGAVAPFWSVRGTRCDFASALRGATRWWGLSMSNVLYQLQAPVLAAVANTVVVGLYAMSSRVIGPLLLLPASLATVIIPELARRITTGGARELHRKFSSLCLAYAVVAVACAWPIGFIVTRIAGPEYHAALPLVAGMVCAAGLSAYTQALAALLIAAGQPNQVTACVSSGGVLALLLLAVLGVWGSVASLAAAQVAAEVVVLTGLLVAVRRLRAAGVVP
jgi:O-antigen/teichoic acid export membrane protein